MVGCAVHGFLYNTAELPQRLIAGIMTEMIVEFLQFIDIANQQRNRFLAALVALPFIIEHPAEFAPVRQLRQAARGLIGHVG